MAVQAVALASGMTKSLEEEVPVVVVFVPALEELVAAVQAMAQASVTTMLLEAQAEMTDRVVMEAELTAMDAAVWVDGIQGTAAVLSVVGVVQVPEAATA